MPAGEMIEGRLSAHLRVVVKLGREVSLHDLAFNFDWLSLDQVQELVVTNGQNVVS